MAINNLNPRRTVWFSPHEPLNKYDIWLSKNAHYDENGEPTTDSNAQRDCDYIFKIYDCNKWNPIVGFNTTAAHKIDTVDGVTYIDSDEHSYTGKTKYHPAIFTDLTPNELFDYGSMGEVLMKLVSDDDWESIYNIHLKTIIEDSEFELWLAEPNRIGGICSNSWSNDSDDEFVSCRLGNNELTSYYTYSNTYESQDYRKLYVSAGSIQKALEAWMIGNNQGFDPQALLSSFDINGGVGILIFETTNNLIRISLKNANANPGKYLKVNSTGTDIEWVNIPSGTTYTEGIGIDINQTNNTISQNIEELEEYQGGIKLLTLSQNQNGSITISGDNTELLTVNPYEIQYLNIPGCQNINITLLKSCTNPVYIYLKTLYDLTIYDSEFDYSGDGLINNLIKSGNVLITALFGIAKIEYISNFDSNA